MLQKQPRSTFRRYFGGTLKFIVFAEATGFILSYLVWSRLNSSQDFRLYMHKNYNWALEGYYTIGETISSDNIKIREQDIATWKANGSI